MEILFWIAAGIGAGLFAQFLVKDKWRGGFTGNLVVGAMGGVVGGWVMMRLFRTSDTPGVDIGNLICAFLGAVALLWVGRLIAARKPHR